MGESIFPSHQVLCPNPQPTTDPQGLQPPPRAHSVPSWALGSTWKGMDQSTHCCSPPRLLMRVRTLSTQVPTSRPPAREKAMAKRGLPPNQAVLSVATWTESGQGWPRHQVAKNPSQEGGRRWDRQKHVGANLKAPSTCCLQNTGSKIKVLRISRQQLPSIIPQAQSFSEFSATTLVTAEAM